MSETSGAGGKKTKGERRKPPMPGGKAGGRVWNAAADGSNMSRTISFGSTDEASKAARRAVSTFSKAGQPIDLRLEGSTLTVRVAAEGGAINDQVKRLTNRIAPKDPAKKAAKDAKAAGAEG
jgi:hypothetical protein